MLDGPSTDYHILTASDVSAYLANHSTLAEHLGGLPSEWACRDVADGNLNSVFLIDGPDGGLCVKQALPYVRVAGESWPMDINRAFFEYSYTSRLEPFVGTLLPKIYHFDEVQFIILAFQSTSLPLLPQRRSIPRTLPRRLK